MSSLSEFLDSETPALKKIAPTVSWARQESEGKGSDNTTKVLSLTLSLVRSLYDLQAVCQIPPKERRDLMKEVNKIIIKQIMSELSNYDEEHSEYLIEQFLVASIISENGGVQEIVPQKIYFSQILEERTKWSWGKVFLFFIYLFKMNEGVQKAIREYISQIHRLCDELRYEIKKNNLGDYFLKKVTELEGKIVLMATSYSPE